MPEQFLLPVIRQAELVLVAGDISQEAGAAVAAAFDHLPGQGRGQKGIAATAKGFMANMFDDFIARRNDDHLFGDLGRQRTQGALAMRANGIGRQPVFLPRAR